MGGTEIDNSQFQFSKTFILIADNMEEAEINLENAKKQHNIQAIDIYEKEVDYFRFRN